MDIPAGIIQKRRDVMKGCTIICVLIVVLWLAALPGAKSDLIQFMSQAYIPKSTVNK